ncbi:MAG: sulfatase [Candidatus Hydrogenedentes bacterium]|nr:sulfatase [Candidatus Hydrogenedentota bacterium]
MTTSALNDITRRAFLVSAGAGVVSAAAHAKTVAAPKRQPNVVYVFSDEHRWQSMSFTELPQVITPNMAQLAEESAEFTNCISNYPVCSPYRGILLTGRWPQETGVVDNNIPLSPNEQTVGKSFRNGGWRTGYIGKWHLGGTRAEPFGFDHSLIWEKTNIHWDTSEYYPSGSAPVTPKGYNATLMTDQALEFMEGNTANPFCLFVSLNPPHANFTDAPEGKKALYPEGALPRRPNWQDGRPADASPEAKFFSNNGWPYYEGYHAHISAIDDELGRIMKKLEELGIEENTILVYTSDHGSMFGSHGVGGKRQPFEESIRVPFLVRWPGRIEAKKKVDSLFGTIDIVPTLCALAGAKAPRRCSGQDYSDHLVGGGGPDPKSQFIMHIAKGNASGKETHPAPLFRGIRTKKHTYFMTSKGKGSLFDNAKDPYQLADLFGTADSRSVREKCEKVTRAWLKSVNDSFSLEVKN